MNADAGQVQMVMLDVSVLLRRTLGKYTGAVPPLAGNSPTTTGASSRDCVLL